MKTAYIALIGLMSSGWLAAPSYAADLANGEVLHDQECISCHAGLVKGADPDSLYTRPNRFIKSRDALAKQVARCEVVAGARWFDDQREDVVEYLNHEFYKFK